MYKLLKVLLIVISLLLGTTNSNAFSGSALSKAFRGVPLLKITPDVLSKYSKVEQVSFLVERARLTGRISSVRSLWLQKQFNKIPGGEKILQQCLIDPKCEPEKVVKRVKDYSSKTGAFPSLQISQMIAKDDLYYRLAMKTPNSTPTQLKLEAGKIAEDLMDKNFKNSGWVKLEGEVGRNGFDGLYVKLDKSENIKKVMIVESKYGNARLKRTVDGATQMSKKWSIKKVDALIKKYPNDPKYKQIKEHILKEHAKYRIYRLQAKNGKLYQAIEKINPKEENVSISKLTGNERYKVNRTQNSEIDLSNPDGKYQESISEIYMKHVQ